MNQHLMAGGFSFALLLLCGVGIASYLSSKRLLEDANWVEHTYQVMLTIEHLDDHYKDAEAWQDNYILTRQSFALEAYQKERDLASSELKLLRKLTLDNPNQQRRIAELEPLLARKFDQLTKIIAQVQKEQFPLTNKNLITELKPKDTTFQQILAALKSEETVLLRNRLSSTLKTFYNTVFTIVFGYGFSLILLSRVFFWLSNSNQKLLRAEAEKQKHLQLLDLANDTIMIRTLDDEIIYWNQGAVHLYGWTQAEVLGKTVHCLLQTVFPQPLEEIQKEFLRRGYWQGELTHTKRDGTQMIVASRWTLHRNELDSLTTILEINNDITEQKQVERKLEEVNQSLEKRIDERTLELSTALAKLEREVVERQQAEYLLQRSEGRLSAIFNQAFVGIAQISPEGKILLINETFSEILGYPPEDIINQYWQIFTYPEDLEASLEFVQRVLNSGKLFGSLEKRYLHKNGSVVWADVNLSMVLNTENKCEYFIAVIQDISSRKQAEAAQRRTDELYRTLIYNFPNGVVLLFDQDLRYLVVEGGGLAHSIFTKEQIEGKTIWEILPAEFCSLLEPLYRAALAGESNSVEVPFLDRVHKLHLLPIKDESGKIFAGMIMSQDVTLQKQAEQALKQSHDALEKQVQKRTQELLQANALLQAEIAERIEAEQQLGKITLDLKRSNQELEQFAYIASHDLQEPLRAVIGYTQLLEQEYKDALEEEALEYLEFIVDGAKRMQRLIQDLLIYSRVGTRTQEFSATDCNAILQEVLKNLQVAIAEKMAKIDVDHLPIVIADATQLMQLWQNLIGNALKFCRNQAPEVHIWAELHNTEWLFSIRDNGIGIKPEYFERIFIIFKRLHTRTEFEGTGIGLALCQKIVERHGGRIWLESEMGVGTTFFFTLPVSRDKIHE
ncbi:MAG: PAS domain S-box protein [Actinomycetota bacterium]